MKHKLFIKDFLLLIFIFGLHIISYGQEYTYSQAQEKIIQQANTESTGVPIGLFLTFDNVLDPLRLFDKAPNGDEELSGLEKIDPIFQLTLGYESPWVLRNLFRVMLAFEFSGRYQFLNNDLLSDYKKYLYYQLVVGLNITPYLYVEFDSRGLGTFVVSYAHRVSRESYLLYSADTHTRLWGALYNEDGTTQSITWQYTSLNVSYFYSPAINSFIHAISLETRLKIRFQNAPFNHQFHPDTGDRFSPEVPNWNELMYVALKMQVDIWFNPYIVVRPYMEFFMDGFEITSQTVPYGLNTGIALHFLI